MFAAILLIAIVAAFIFAIVLFNALVRKRNAAKNAFSQIDVQLKRRHDLVPNLVSSVKQYMTHEQTTLENVISARNKAASMQKQADHSAENGSHMNLLSQAEGMLSKAMGQFYAVMENYPELKANDVIMELINELQNTEDRIGFARQGYNDSVMFYNNAREVFPSNIIASSFAFHEMNFLHFDDRKAIQKAPSVSF